MKKNDFQLHAWNHRVGKVLSFFSRELELPHPISRWRVCVSPFGPGGGHTRLRERGWGSPNSDEGTYTVVLYVYKYFVLGTLQVNYIFHSSDIEIDSSCNC